MSADIPIPITNPVVPLSTIFWNGEAAPLNKDGNGKANIPSPEASGAAKTITITNYGTDTLYPYLRTANDGKDPNDSLNRYYDPQDLHSGEFREYVGYAKSDGSKYLGLPSGATITFQVPLALWDGDNISLVTDGTNLTTPMNAPAGTLFGYDPSAQISTAGNGQIVSNSTWVQGGSNYPVGQSPLVMFYYSTSPPLTTSDDAPSQPAEVTFRDPYLKNFIDDSFQTFALLNYDVTNVNKLSAPASMEASNVPITSGSVQSNNLQYYLPNKDFGWHGSNKDAATLTSLIKSFVTNQGPASVGDYYFGGAGWPQYYNPNPNEYIIPSGSNIFDNSPLNVHVGDPAVNRSHYDNNRWLLSSSGGGAIQASAGGDVLNDPNATMLPLEFGPGQRAVFIQNIASMVASKQAISFTISTSDPKYQGVLGTLVSYNPSSQVRAINITPGAGGSGYGPNTKVIISGANGNGVDAVGQVNIGKNGEIESVGLVNPGSGYTSPPTITFFDPSGRGKGAKATADITGGTAVVKLADGRTLPTGVGMSYVFQRTGTDYAAAAITNLWYSWANYYVKQFANFTTETAQGAVVYSSIGGGPQLLTNQITLTSPPAVPLAVGMTVTAAQGIPAGTTILKIDGNTIYLSQLPDANTPPTQTYTFGKPQTLALDAVSAQYTHPYDLSFAPADQQNAKLFAASVYESMAIQAVGLPPSPYLPTSMNLVAHVVKFWANLPTHDKSAWGTILVGEARDIAKSILRGVYDYYQVPDQSLWYPDPKTYTGGQKFNVYNLDPYVWFVHKVAGLTGYGFSIDDDLANPSATGPRGDDSNHFPSNLQIGFAGTKGTGKLSHATPLTNQEEWFPTTKWGSIQTTATIGIQQDGAYKGYSVITLTGPNPLRTLNQILTPGPGQVGAYISAPGFIVPGTTLIYFPNGVDDAKNPTIILSQNAISTTTPITITIDAAQMTIPRVLVNNPSFTNPPQTNAPYYTVDPSGPNVSWSFNGSAGVAGTGSVYTRNNPAPVGSQVAFIEDQGGISQMVNLTAGGAYAVSFLVAQRRLDDGSVNMQSLQVKIDKQIVGDFTASPTSDGRYVLFTSNAFTVKLSGSHRLAIVGVSAAGSKNSALIDNVVITGGLAARLGLTALNPPIRRAVLVKPRGFMRSSSVSGRVFASRAAALRARR
ncbi:hypothetical protein [Paludisphaera borealis]|nr:hypothetical protein [Paludisphaera borealis]